MQIPARAAGDADDLRAFGQGLDLLGVVGRDAGSGRHPGHQVDPRDVGMGRQLPGQIHDVRNLPAGVGVAPELDVVSPHQSVDAEHQQVQTVAGFLGRHDVTASSSGIAGGIPLRRELRP